MEKIYLDLIKQEEGNEIFGGGPPTTLFQGEEAFYILITSVSVDRNGYKFRMSRLDHDTVIRICSDISPYVGPSYKRIGLNRELKGIGLHHMSGYITYHRSDRTYSVNIRKLTYHRISSICKTLFMW